MALTAAFLVAIALASVIGVRTYQSQRASSVGLRPAVAVLSQAGPLFYGFLGRSGTLRRAGATRGAASNPAC